MIFKKVFEGISLGSNRLHEFTNNAVEGAKEAVEQISTDLGSVKKYVSDSASSSVDQVSAFFEAHWPTIEHVLVDGLLAISIEKLKDDQLVQGVIEKAYETLPVGVRLVLPRDRYLEFVIN